MTWATSCLVGVPVVTRGDERDRFLVSLIQGSRLAAINQCSLVNEKRVVDGSNLPSCLLLAPFLLRPESQ